MTPEEQKRRDELNDRWTRRYDYSPPLHFTAEEHRERDVLNQKHARIPTPAPKPSGSAPAPPRTAVVARQVERMKQSVAEFVAQEVATLRRERELQDARIDAALARVEAALARLDAKG